MKGVLLFLVCALVLNQCQGYCYINAPDPTHMASCKLENDKMIDVNVTVVMEDKCEKCSCVASTEGAALSCCGYGINAGTFAPAPGCKIVRDGASCEMKMVQIDNEAVEC